MNGKYNEIYGEIIALKSLLADTDYKCLKYAEGELTEAEYAETKAKRAEWRAKINTLQAELDSMDEPAE
jgi:hypothetical protein